MTAERLPALDGLRGPAILLVLLLHFTVYGGPAATGGVDKLFYRAAQAGWIGVDLFFVLSEFLITGILYDAKGGENYFRSFYARRVLRIFPLYYGALAVFLLLVPALRRDTFWYWTYLSNVQIAREGWPDFGARRLLFILLATLVSAALAWVSWHLWEKRFLQLKRLFPYRAAPAERVAVGAPP